MTFRGDKDQKPTFEEWEKDVDAILRERVENAGNDSVDHKKDACTDWFTLYNQLTDFNDLVKKYRKSDHNDVELFLKIDVFA